MESAASAPKTNVDNSINFTQTEKKETEKAITFKGQVKLDNRSINVTVMVSKEKLGNLNERDLLSLVQKTAFKTANAFVLAEHAARGDKISKLELSGDRAKIHKEGVEGHTVTTLKDLVADAKVKAGADTVNRYAQLLLREQVQVVEKRKAQNEPLRERPADDKKQSAEEYELPKADRRLGGQRPVQAPEGARDRKSAEAEERVRNKTPPASPGPKEAHAETDFTAIQNGLYALAEETPLPPIPTEPLPTPPTANQSPASSNRPNKPLPLPPRPTTPPPAPPNDAQETPRPAPTPPPRAPAAEQQQQAAAPSPSSANRLPPPPIPKRNDLTDSRMSSNAPPTPPKRRDELLSPLQSDRSAIPEESKEDAELLKGIKEEEAPAAEKQKIEPPKERPASPLADVLNKRRGALGEAETDAKAKAAQEEMILEEQQGTNKREPSGNLEEKQAKKPRTGEGSTPPPPPPPPAAKPAPAAGRPFGDNDLQKAAARLKETGGPAPRPKPESTKPISDNLVDKAGQRPNADLGNAPMPEQEWDE